MTTKELSVESDLGDILERLIPASVKWYYIGLGLKVSSCSLDKIKVDFPNVDDRLCEVIKEWLKSASAGKTWEVILKVLCQEIVKESALANSIVCQLIETTDEFPKSKQTEASPASSLQEEKFGSPVGDNDNQVKSKLPQSKFDKLKDQSDEDRIDLQGKLRHEYLQIDQYFARFVNKLRDSLISRKISPTQLIESIQHLKACTSVGQSEKCALHERIDELKKAKNISEIFVIFNDYMSFFSYELLEYIIEELGSEDDHTALQQYQDKFNEYCKHSIYECPYFIDHKYATTAKLIAKYYCEIKSQCSMQSLKVLEIKLAAALKVAHPMLRLSGARSGCIELCYQIPEFLKDLIFPLSDAQKIALADLSIMKLTCDDTTVFLNESLSSEIESEFDEENIQSMEKSTTSLDQTELQSSRSRSTVSSDKMVLITDIHRSCFEGNYDEFKAQLDQLDEVNILLTQRDDRGWLVLHNAASSGEVQIISELLSKGCSPRDKTLRERDTALHIATANGHSQAVGLLIEKLLEENRLSSLQNKEGNTPLHLACMIGHLELVATFSERLPGQLTVTNAQKRTPSNVATSEKVTDVILKHGRGNPAKFGIHFRGLDSNQSLDVPLNIFVMGEQGSGKSTFIASLQLEKKRDRFVGISTNTPKDRISDHTIGVIQTEFNSRFYGRVVFQDIASGSDLIHNDIITAIEDLSNAIFVVVIDSRPERRSMEYSLESWLNILTAQCKKLPSTSCKPNLIIISSFSDVIKRFRLAPAERLNRVLSAVRHRGGLIDSFNIIGAFWLDCRKAYSTQLDILQRSLKSIAKQLQVQNEPVPSRCYMLSSHLKNLEILRYGSIPALNLQDLSISIYHDEGASARSHVSAASTQSKKSTASGIDIITVLPHDTAQLFPLCQILNDRKRILLLTEPPGDQGRNIWIIYDLDKAGRLIEGAFRDYMRKNDLTKIPLDDEDTVLTILSSVSALPSPILFELLRHFKLPSPHSQTASK